MKKEKKDEENKKNKVSFYEHFLNAIRNKDIEFVKNNMDKISFIDYGIQNAFWNEITLFQEVIVNNFVEAFELIIEKFAKEKDFKPHVKEFNYIVMNACYYAKHEILQVLKNKYNLDLNFHNMNKLGIIHLVFESINDDMLNSNIVPDEDIVNTILWLRENNVNTFELYPLLKTEDKNLTTKNTSISRKTYHSIYSYLIAKDKFKIFSIVKPKGKMFEVLKKQDKFKDTILYLQRYLSFFNKPLHIDENEGLFSKNIKAEEFLLNEEELLQKRSMEDLQSKYANYDKKIAESLLIELIKDHDVFLIEVLSSEDNKENFLSHINDLTLYRKLPKEIYSKIIEELFNKNRKNEKMYTPINWIIKNEFKNPLFFEEINYILINNENSLNLLKNNEEVIDEMITSFINQNNPPTKEILMKQIDLIKKVNGKNFETPISYKENMSNKVLIEKKIEEWIEEGFYIDIEI